MCFICPEDVKKTAVYQKTKARFRKSKQGTRVYFLAAINIAAELVFLPPKKSVVWVSVTGFVLNFKSCEITFIRATQHRKIYP